MDALSLYELNALVRRSLEQCLPDAYWIQAELSDVRTNSTGHCYLEFVQEKTFVRHNLYATDAETGGIFVHQPAVGIYLGRRLVEPGCLRRP